MHLSQILLIQKRDFISLVFTLCTLGTLWLNCPVFAVKSGDKAPEFILSSYDGKPYQLSRLKGKYVVLNFFATWCEPCKKELPEIIKFYDVHKTSNVIVLLLSLDVEGRAVVNKFIKQYHPTMPVLLFAELPNKTYKVNNKLPTTFVISPDGTVISRLDGYQEKMYDELYAAIFVPKPDPVDTTVTMSTTTLPSATVQISSPSAATEPPKPDTKK